MKKIIAILAILLFTSMASAAPTPKATQLLWDDYTDPDGVGYYLYWAKENEQSPRLYDNTRRVDVGANTNEVIIASAISAVNIKGRMCFKLTAYDAAVPRNESDFSNEACGFFGVPNPKNLQAG